MRVRDLLSPPPPTTLDDRGARVTILPAALEQAESIEENPDPPLEGPPPPPRPWRDGLLLVGVAVFLLSVLGLGAVLLVRITRRLSGTLGLSPVTVGLMGLGIAAFVVVASLRWSRSRVTPEERRVLCAGLISSRKCGACAYTLDSLLPEADGCTPCPECGAAWRIEVWIRENPAFRQPAAGVLERPRRALTVSDARGRQVALFRPLRTPAEVWRIRGMALAWFALACVVFAVVAPLAARLFGTDPVLASVIFWMLCGGAALLTLLRLDRAPRSVRLLAARKSIDGRSCPACGSPLDAEPSIIDGALLCPGCGSAWKQDATPRAL